MAAGDEREALAGIGDRLCVEFGYVAVEKTPPETPSRAGPTRTGLFDGSLKSEDEQLIAAARYSLTRLAEALEARRLPGVPETAVPALLDGAELVMRGELAMGTPPSTLMPSFVFLVTLPLVDQDEALELSHRAASMLEGL